MRLAIDASWCVSVLALSVQLCPKLDYQGADGADDPAVRSLCVLRCSAYPILLRRIRVLRSSTTTSLLRPRLHERLEQQGLPNSFGLLRVRLSCAPAFAASAFPCLGGARAALLARVLNVSLCHARFRSLVPLCCTVARCTFGLVLDLCAPVPVNCLACVRALPVASKLGSLCLCRFAFVRCVVRFRFGSRSRHAAYSERCPFVFARCGRSSVEWPCRAFA